MPRKTRRMKERAALRRATLAEGAPDGADTNQAPRATLSPSARPSFATPTFDYSHIYGDLRRIAFFAIFFFGVLIALSFVIK